MEQLQPDGLRVYPPKPQKPLASDCCGNGCTPCVLDIYDEELEMWQDECIRIQNGDTSMVDDTTSELSTLQKDQYTRFTIAAITQESCDTLRVKFSLHSSQSLGLAVGQHIIIRVTSASGSLTRQYTPVSPIQTKGHFEFVLKIYPTGLMSNVMKSWLVGDDIDMRGPVGNKVYSPNKHRRVLMLCAGTGIAPMCQVVHSILDNEEDETLVRLVYACKNYSQILVKSEILEWRRYWNFSCVFVLSQEPPIHDYVYRYGEEIIRGHIDERMVQDELGDCIDKTLVLVCGTRSFDSDMLGFARKLGVMDESLHKF